MRRAFALFRPTAVVHCVQPAAFRPTRVLHIPPQLVRLIVAGGLLVFQAFVVAHNREAQRLREEADGTATGESCSTALMSSSEALHILGMDDDLRVPLEEKKDREEARRRFNHLFAIAKNNNNAYLQGKLALRTGSALTLIGMRTKILAATGASTLLAVVVNKGDCPFFFFVLQLLLSSSAACAGTPCLLLVSGANQQQQLMLPGEYEQVKEGRARKGRMGVGGMSRVEEFEAWDSF
ncbi:hypothetical protein C4B63_2g71 [Trypanosoma cruzi]|uniref:Uncharacterized protein n=1 Tax=Trypanosoma cruzi TaxID=5693 RepID=A0A2V2W1F9_TRYCR|nr:hypothetical protein C4B63_2g71 [Trypanosoma cruzi]